METYIGGNGKGLMGSSANSNGNAAMMRGNRTTGGRRHPRPDLLSGPGFNVQRRPRMPRSRRSSLEALAFPGSHVPPLPVAREIDVTKLAYLFKKQLKNSDVGVLRRMVLPKRESEIHLPVLESKEGIPISMLDMDGIHEWWFKYRFWPNNSSRMYVLEYTGKIDQTLYCASPTTLGAVGQIGQHVQFIRKLRNVNFEPIFDPQHQVLCECCTTENPNPVKFCPICFQQVCSFRNKCHFDNVVHISLGEFVYTHGLVTDDFILVYQNVEDGRYIIEARKKGQDVAPRVANNLVINEAAPELEIPELPLIDDTEMLYAYDTTFLDDSPLDYMGDSINLPSIGSDSSFEAIEDYNPDDFEFE